MDEGMKPVTALKLEKFARRWVKASKKRQANLPVYSKDPMMGADPVAHESTMFDDPMADSMSMLGDMGASPDDAGGEECGDAASCLDKIQ